LLRIFYLIRGQAFVFWTQSCSKKKSFSWLSTNPAKPIIANVPDNHFDPPSCQFNTSCALFNSTEQLRKAVSRFFDSVPESHFQAPVLRHKRGFLDFAYKVVSAVAPKIVDLFSVHTESEVRKQLNSQIEPVHCLEVSKDAPLSSNQQIKHEIQHLLASKDLLTGKANLVIRELGDSLSHAVIKSLGDISNLLDSYLQWHAFQEAQGQCNDNFIPRSLLLLNDLSELLVTAEAEAAKYGLTLIVPAQQALSYYRFKLASCDTSHD